MLKYFSKTELFLWTSSTLFIVISFIIWDRANYLTLIASLIGVIYLGMTASMAAFSFVAWINNKGEAKNTKAILKIF